MELDANEVLEEIRNINPMVVELAMERVARKWLEKEAESMRRAFTEMQQPKITGVPDTPEVEENSA